MSKTVFQSGNVVLSRHTGPAAEGPDRRRWQLSILNPDGYATLDYEQFCAVAQGILLEYATMHTPQFLAMLDEARQEPTSSPKTVREHGEETFQAALPGPAFERFVNDRWAGLSGDARTLALDAFAHGGVEALDGLAAILELETSNPIARGIARDIRAAAEARRDVAPELPPDPTGIDCAERYEGAEQPCEEEF